MNAPTVSTGPATALGLTAISANGSIHPHGAPTSYCFEYGESGAFGSRTEELSLPARLSAYYAEGWDDGIGGWGCFGNSMIHLSEGDRKFIRVSYPCDFDDFNHEGCGVLHLASFMYCGSVVNPESSSFHYPGAFLGGGDPDLRDARISLSLRGVDWVPNGAELIWWSQSQPNMEAGNTPEAIRSNWGYSGVPLTDYLDDGEWHHVEYALSPDTTKWSYGGYNSGQEGSARRYGYWPIQDVLAHANCNIFHLVAFVDPDNHPTGHIDIDDYQLVYRNRSLLIPSNGGRLVDWPRNSGDDPGTLTDGWRHGEGKVWKTAPAPAEPQEFLYSFEDRVTIHDIQIHQNPEWPTNAFELLISQDGATFTELIRSTLPESGDPNSNFAFSLHRELNAETRWLKVRLLSGHRSEHWGLGEIEVFGIGAILLPEDTDTSVSRDLTGLSPGQEIHYRLVATNRAGTSYGESRIFTVPETARPRLEIGSARRISGTSARMIGRLNPLGLKTNFHFEYGPDLSMGNRTRATFAGEQETPRLASADISGLTPDTEYHCRLVAENEAGISKSDVGAFRTLQVAR